MRSLYKIIFYSLFILFFTAFDYLPQGFLRIDGKKIVNDVDDNFILKGMGLGGWLVQ